jgi:hypothetical protein
MSDAQFERLCHTLTGILVLFGLFAVVLTVNLLRARSVKQYMERVRQDPALIKEAQEDFTFKKHVVTAMWIVYAIGSAFRVWAYIVHGV